LGVFLASDQPSQFLLGELSETVQILDLGLQSVVGTVKPKPAVNGPVYSQGTAYGVAEVSGSDRVVLGKYLDTLG
jgi:hypothetical protein